MLQHDDRDAACQDVCWTQVGNAVTNTASRLLERCMEERRDEFCRCGRHERSPGRRALRNGFYTRRLDTRYGSLSLRVPRVRGASVSAEERFARPVVEAYRRRQRDVDDALLWWLARGQSTREASATVADVFAGTLSAGGVSRVAAELDEEIDAFHRRDLTGVYRFAFLDAKHWHVNRLRRGRGRGPKRKAVLLIAWGIRYDGREELIDFRVARSESEASWTAFLTDLEARGLGRGRSLEMITTDGDAGLRAALAMVYPEVPWQMCVFHKVQGLAGHLLDKGHRAGLLSAAAAIYKDLRAPAQARQRLKRFARYWRPLEPGAVQAMVMDFEATLTYLAAPPEWRRRVKTSNPAERFIRELNRKTNKVGPYPSDRSWERATYMVWRKLQAAGYAPAARAAAHAAFTQNP